MPWKPEHRALRVLAADDSAVMRRALRTIFDLHAQDSKSLLPKMQLCGVAEDGMACLRAIKRLQPDVLLLDFEMPVLNGLEVLSRLRVEAPWLPVIMCSAYTERGAKATLDALTLGAKDYVMKPSQQSDFASALDVLMEQLLPRIAAIAGPIRTPDTVATAFSKELQTAAGLETMALETLALETRARAAEERIEVVVIGVSTGGPAALEVMLPTLPKDLPVPVLIVQHMPRLYTGALAKRLDGLCALNVREAVKGDPVQAGCIYLAPGDAHMELTAAGRERRNPAVHLHQGPALNSCMPSADYLFRSAAALYGAGTLAVVMTGMGADGVEGARAVYEAGGTVLAQDEASSAVWGMPGRVSRAGIARETLPLNRLAQEITRLVRAGRGTDAGVERDLAPQRMAREELYGVL